MKISARLLFVAISAQLLVLGINLPAQTLTADYQFQNSHASSVAGAPTLTDLIRPGQTCPAYCNTFATETVYGNSQSVLAFPYDNGLGLAPTTSVLSNNGIYTIGILARFNNLAGQYTRLIEFKNGTNDRGLYFYNHQLVFFSYGIYGPTIVNENAYAFVVLTRDGAGMITGYVNGWPQFTVDDSSNQYGVIDSNNVLRFFQDNLTGASGEDSAGAVARIRIWDGVLSADDIAALSGGILYAADGASKNPNCHLYILNPGDGSVTLDIGPIGFAVTALAFDPHTGILYGGTGSANGSDPSPPFRAIITINPQTGVGTLVGAEGPGGPLADITFTSDGTLYGWGEGSDDLYTVNKSTGFATKVAESNFCSFGSGISANSSDVLYFGGDCAGPGSGHLATVDRMTGQVTLGPQFSGAPLPSGSLNAFAFNADDVLYASNGGDSGSKSTAHLVTINTATGAITDHGSTLNKLDAIAFLPTCDHNPPVITVPQTIDVVAQTKKVNHRQGAYVSFSVSAFDPEDGPVAAIASPPSGSFFPVGVNTVTVTATDSCGNTSVAYFAVDVSAKKKKHAPF
jgi:hypothetical protein